MHIFFDNVFDVYEDADEEQRTKWSGDEKKWKILNKWVVQFFEQLQKALVLFRKSTDVLKKGRIVLTPYGGRMEYTIANTPLIIHLKDADKVQKGKRWSQVMYLYYLIGWKIDACQEMEISGLVEKMEKDKCFILALDGDVDFDPPALDSVLNRMKRNEYVAACCGQIHPKGSGWLVGYQRFEYAVGHWLQKTAEHVLGCVLCSPGCFSLMRISNLASANVMAMYKSLAKTPLQKLQFDQGEDRWLCTLLLTSGGRIEFEASSHCNTFAPEDLGTFYKQRRRWGPSTTANVWELIRNQREARKNNPYISMPYILYHLFMLIFSQIGVSTTIMMVAEAFFIGLGYELGKGICYTIVLIPVVLFVLACLLSNNSDLQISMATWLSLAYSFLMAVVLIGIIMEGVNCPFSPSFLFFMGLAGIHIVAGLINFDIWTLPCGIIYFLFIPSCFIFLQIYSVANLNDVSWGTRQGAKTDTKTDNRTFLQKVLGAKVDETGATVKSDGTTCSCILCPTIEHSSSEQPTPQIAETKSVEIQTEEPGTMSDEPEEQNMERMGDTASAAGISAAGFSVTTGISMATTEVASDEQMSILMPSVLNTQNLEKKINDRKYDFIMTKPIFRESYYGGHTIKVMRNYRPAQWTEKITNCADDSQFRSKNNPIQSTDTANIFSSLDLFRREILQFEREQIYLSGEDKEKIYRTSVNYLGWVLSSRSPIDPNCTVHVLSNPEFQFWKEMCSTDGGYIGIRTKSKNFQQLKKDEEQLMKDLTAFRTEKFALYLFINTLWIIVSTIVLKYTSALLQVPIEIPGSFQNCGTPEEEEEATRDIEENFPEDESVIMILQPFSLFFLFFYITLILTQFVCMLWHRVSTLYHFVAQIDSAEQRAEIKSKKEHNYESKLVVEDKTDEDHNLSARQKKIQYIRKTAEATSSFYYDERRRKSTIRFEEHEVQPENIDEIVNKREERRRTSLFTDGILFASYQEGMSPTLGPSRASVYGKRISEQLRTTETLQVTAEVEEPVEKELHGLEMRSTSGNFLSRDPAGNEQNQTNDNDDVFAEPSEDEQQITTNKIPNISMSAALRRNAIAQLTDTPRTSGQISVPLAPDRTTRDLSISKGSLVSYSQEFYPDTVMLEIEKYIKEAEPDKCNTLQPRKPSILRKPKLRAISPTLTRRSSGLNNPAFFGDLESIKDDPDADHVQMISETDTSDTLNLDPTGQDENESNA